MDLTETKCQEAGENIVNTYYFSDQAKEDKMWGAHSANEKNAYFLLS